MSTPQRPGAGDAGRSSSASSAASTSCARRTRRCIRARGCPTGPPAARHGGGSPAIGDNLAGLEREDEQPHRPTGAARSRARCGPGTPGAPRPARRAVPHLSRPLSLVCPCDQGLVVLVGKACLRVDDYVVPGGHLAIVHCLDRLLEVLLLLLSIGPLPGRKVQLLAPLADVVRQQPRDRRDWAVPGPRSSRSSDSRSRRLAASP